MKMMCKIAGHALSHKSTQLDIQITLVMKWLGRTGWHRHLEQAAVSDTRFCVTEQLI